MEVHFSPDMEARLDQLAQVTGRPKEELVQDAMAGYLEELEQLRETLDRRYDEIKSGKVKMVDGEEFFESLRQREAERIKSSSPR
jgi:predicted DNA-binding protein